MNTENLLQEQKQFFAGGKTLSVSYRIAALKKLKAAILQHETEICAALHADLGKSRTESYLSEIGMVLSELSFMIKRVKAFQKDERVKTPLSQFSAKSFIKKSPYGCVLIMSPWNYPFLLTMEPLTDALAAGNCAIVKPSAYSPETSRVIKELLEKIFPPEYVAVVTGGRAENTELLHLPFDKIFFTGSSSVGKEVMKAAAERLIPVTLELGGKSPCIVDETANVPLAAKRIVFGKFLNCGQTCVAPDYVAVHSSVEEKLLTEIKKQIALQLGEQPLGNGDYGKIVNQKHFDRICALIDREKVYCGGQVNEDTLRIAPTVMRDVVREDAVMQEEIFGPVLPVLVYDDREELIYQINHAPKPLALYVFSSDKSAIDEYLSRCRFGGGCVNDTVIHLATSRMGFGGVGESGMGSYHGKDGFDCFTHRKSIVDKKTRIDLPMRYQPYTEKKLKIIRKFLK